MVVTDTVEGTINQVLWYHYDRMNDVLYLRLMKERSTETVAEETPEGFLLLKRMDADIPVGLTVVDWWKRFGTGAAPDSIKDLEHRIEPWSQRLAG
jgi:hypothetical protein